MSERTQGERLQPSLLDRLIDDHPDQLRESREQRVMSVHRLRQAVLRDLGWLLNTVHLEATDDLDEAPEAVSSVINYGIPDLAGRCLSAVDLHALERTLRQAVVRFEPRLRPESVRVRLKADSRQMSHNALTFDIEGELWSDPLPLHLYLKTEVDLELGNVIVTEYGRTGGGG